MFIIYKDIKFHVRTALLYQNRDETEKEIKTSSSNHIITLDSVKRAIKVFAEYLSSYVKAMKDCQPGMASTDTLFTYRFTKLGYLECVIFMDITKSEKTARQTQIF
jgi:hypothetical protein